MTALNPLSPDPRYLGGQEGHHLRLLVTWGKLAEAKRLLDARNKLQAAFGARIFEMPPPYETGLPECIAVPAYSRIRFDVDPQTGNARIAA